MERSERGRSLEGGGRFDVRVEIEGSVCLRFGGVGFGKLFPMVGDWSFPY